MKLRFLWSLVPAVLFSLLLMPALPAHAQQTKWRLAHQWPTVHFYHRAAEQFAKNVEQRSGGRLKIDIFPASQLYGMREIPEAVINGAIDIGMAADVGYSGFVPTMALFDLPMLVPDGKTMFKLLDGRLGRELAADLGAKGMTLLGWLDYGPMDYLTGPKQIRTPADVAGLKITVPGGLFADAVAALGGAPMVTPPPEHYVALQRGMVAGILVGPTTMDARKLFEAQKYLTLVSQSWPVHIATVNTAKLAALPKDLAEIVQSEGRSMQNWVVQQQEEETAKSIAKMRAAGIVVHRVPDEERAAWREKLLKVNDKFLQTTGARGRQLLAIVAEDQ
jgi:tripartite ATP-independent transporter DctP family solute receptor